MRRIAKVALWAGGSFVASLALLAAPVAYVETACRLPIGNDDYAALITDPAWRRAEVRTYLTYPEWQMVYAYEDFADVLQTGDEHRFGYWRSMRDFWSSYCAMNRISDAHGGADDASRMTIWTIGTSFNVEMGLKALYEDTLGRVFTWIRGPEKTPQDQVVADMAKDYGAFLHQTPWYRYDFAGAVKTLQAAPVTGIRSHERRFAIGLEWRAKQAYAQAIGAAVAAVGHDQLRMRSVVGGLSREALAAIDGVTPLDPLGPGVLIETDRYERFTEIVRAVAAAGGDFVEIAGNDDILISLIQKADRAARPADLGQALITLDRQGSGDRRELVALKVSQLAETVRRAPEAGARLEHVYDY